MWGLNIPRKWRLEIYGHVSGGWLGLDSLSRVTAFLLHLRFPHAQDSSKLNMTAKKTYACVAGTDLDLTDSFYHLSLGVLTHDVKDRGQNLPPLFQLYFCYCDEIP